MLDLLDLGRPDVLAARLDGTITDADVQRLTEALAAKRDALGIVRFYVEIGDISGVELRAVATDLAFLARNPGIAAHIGRTAIVTDMAWIRTLAEAQSAVIPLGPVRTYASSGRDEARAWIVGDFEGDEPISEADMP